MARTDYVWKGVWDEGAQGWQEFFGGEDGHPLPTRDLTDADVAEFSPEQKAKLKSETGQRLYRKVEHETAATAKKTTAASDRTSGSSDGDKTP